ncbi:Osiris 2, partial [Operophtera brumata]
MYQVRWLMLAIAAALALQSRGDGPQAQGRGLLDWIGLGEDQDPYIQQATQQVESQARALFKEPPQLSSQPRSEDSDWDSLVKFGMRKIERFLRSTALEMQLDNEVTSDGVIAPRFIDEIADEVDIIEDKKASPFRRHKLKKLIIPMLLILKLFKLKLLLFLPLILGLASFKKFLGFMALIIPGVIGYFKFCKPNISSPFSQSHYKGPQYSPAGIGVGPYREQPAHYGHYESYAGPQYSPAGIGFEPYREQPAHYGHYESYAGPQYSPAGIGIGPYREQPAHYGHYESYAGPQYSPAGIGVGPYREQPAQYGHYESYAGPQYSPAGIGVGPYREQPAHYGHYESYA